MRESKIEKAVCDYAKEKGFRVYKWSSPGVRGVPDRLFFHKEAPPFAIEFKAPGGKLNVVQHKHMSVLNECLGFQIFVVADAALGQKLIDISLNAARGLVNAR